MPRRADQASPNETPQRPPRGCTYLAWIGLLALLWCLFFPEIAWIGGAWLTIEVRVRDSTTGRSIPNATVTLFPDPSPSTPRQAAPPNVLSARTDAKGRATVKSMFGAGGGSHSTTIGVRSSLVRCDAPGYSASEVRVAQSGKLRFRDFPFLAPRNHKTRLTIMLNPR